MNSVKHLFRPANGQFRLIRWPLLCGLFCLLVAGIGTAAQGTYTNNAIIDYPVNVTAPPDIDATNFINNGTFIIDFTHVESVTPYYGTSDTINFTNNQGATMMCNFGFDFDNYSTITGSTNMAGSFYNAGYISCDSSTNSGNTLLFGVGYGLFFAWATNIASPGIVDVGAGGQVQFVGQNVNLANSTMNVEGAAGNIFGIGDFGLNTNAWDPSIDLSSTFAISAPFFVTPFQLVLGNSTSYFNVVGIGTSNVITRAVFIEDTSSSNISYNVYFGANSIGTGDATIEWVGTYQDAATGNTGNNYLYFNDDYLQGVQTNIALVNGVPANYTLVESTSPLNAGTLATPSFIAFPAGSISNFYDFGNITLTSASVSTNQIPNGSITNLPGRVEISATSDLDLSFAQITGPNYLSIQATNQFDGSAGATIVSPYSDINVGVTNGFLTISNLTVPVLPDWSGNIQAWSTRWVEVDSTGVTNDFRVLIIGSQLNPTTLAQVQNLAMHGTNLVISDAFNIMGTFAADAQNLTLTTNGAGFGASSLEGALNFENHGISWGGSLPNVRNLTNNGAIQTVNLAEFISTSNDVSVTPAAPAVAASGILSEVAGRANVLAGNKVIIGTNAYIFEGTVTNILPNQVKIASTFDGSMSNLIAAINRAAGAGTSYSTNTVTNTQVIAGALTGHAFTVSAVVAGLSGNSILAENSTVTTNLTWNVNYYLSGGTDLVASITNISTSTVGYDNFINNGLVSDQGSLILSGNFVNSGTVSNGLGSFTLNSITTTLTNGLITTAGGISIIANNLTISNATLQAGGSLVLSPTNLLTDGITPYTGVTNNGITNANIWVVGSNSTVATLSLLIKPNTGDLLGTTITNIDPAGKQVIDTWAGQDRGYSVSGYNNNAALGRLILDSKGLAAAGSRFNFTGVGSGVTNALYVDYLELRNNATNYGNEVVSNVIFNNNLVIYYAQAVVNGSSVAEKLNHYNNDHFRWVSNYTGYYSSTNIVYPDGTTNVFNAALAQSSDIDSSGSGIANSQNPTPFFIASQVKFALTLTNAAPTAARLTWNSIPSATNYVYYKTNLVSTNWMILTNFVSPSAVPPVGGWPITNVLSDVLTNQARFYQLRLDTQ